jgi:hypothetical protein
MGGFVLIPYRYLISIISCHVLLLSPDLFRQNRFLLRVDCNPFSWSLKWTILACSHALLIYILVTLLALPNDAFFLYSRV